MMTRHSALRRSLLPLAAVLLRRLLVLGLVAVVLTGCPPPPIPSIPTRVLDPEVIGVVVEQRQGSSPPDRTYLLEGGTEIELQSPATELGGPGPGEGRMLIVARDGEMTYFLSMAALDSPGLRLDCYTLYPAAAWQTPEGIVFGFGGIGVRLRASDEYEPLTLDDSGLIPSEQGFCVTPDGMIHPPD